MLLQRSKSAKHSYKNTKWTKSTATRFCTVECEGKQLPQVVTPHEKIMYNRDAFATILPMFSEKTRKCIEALDRKRPEEEFTDKFMCNILDINVQELIDKRSADDKNNEIRVALDLYELFKCQISFSTTYGCKRVYLRTFVPDPENEDVGKLGELVLTNQAQTAIKILLKQQGLDTDESLRQLTSECTPDSAATLNWLEGQLDYYKLDKTLLTLIPDIEFHTAAPENATHSSKLPEDSEEETEEASTWEEDSTADNFQKQLLSLLASSGIDANRITLTTYVRESYSLILSRECDNTQSDDDDCTVSGLPENARTEAVSMESNGSSGSGENSIIQLNPEHLGRTDSEPIEEPVHLKKNKKKKIRKAMKKVTKNTSSTTEDSTVSTEPTTLSLPTAIINPGESSGPTNATDAPKLACKRCKRVDKYMEDLRAKQKADRNGMKKMEKQLTKERNDMLEKYKMMEQEIQRLTKEAARVPELEATVQHQVSALQNCAVISEQKDVHIQTLKSHVPKETILKEKETNRLTSEIRPILIAYQNARDALMDGRMERARKQVLILRVLRVPPDVIELAEYYLSVFFTQCRACEKEVKETIAKIQADVFITRTEIPPLPDLPVFSEYVGKAVQEAQEKHNQERDRECVICHSDSESEWFYCLGCPKRSHLDCAQNWWRTKGEKECPHCKKIQP